MCRDSTAVDLWGMIRAGVIDLSVLGVTVVGLDDPEAALAAASGAHGLDIVVLVPCPRMGGVGDNCLQRTGDARPSG